MNSYMRNVCRGAIDVIQFHHCEHLGLHRSGAIFFLIKEETMMRNKSLMLGLGLVTFLATSCTGNGFDNTRLVVGLECDYAPFNWTAVTANEFTLPIDGVSNQFADGYDVQIARYLGQELEVPVVIKKIAWNSLIPAMVTKDINVIIAGMSYDSDRDVQVDFSSPYYVSDLVAVVRNNSPLVSATSIQDFGGYRVITQLGTLQDSIIDQINNVVHLPGSDSFNTAALSVLASDADAMIAEYPVARAIVNANPTLAIVSFTVGFTGYDENALSVSVAVQEGNDALVASINEALNKLSNETRLTWMNGAIERATV